MLKNIKHTMAELRRREEGVTLVEYGIGLVLAITIGVGALTTLSQQVSTNMSQASSAMVTT